MTAENTVKDLIDQRNRALEAAIRMENQYLRAQEEISRLRQAMRDTLNEIEALPVRSEGYPPYQHSPDWMRQQAADIVLRYLGDQK